MHLLVMLSALLIYSAKRITLEYNAAARAVMGYECKKLVKLAAELLRMQLSLTAAEISEKLHVHRHTLQRALKAGGCSFASIKQSIVLERLERDSASEQPTSLKQLWTELGFGSASSFARYIRRATGKSPHEFRANRSLGHPTHKRAGMSLDVRGKRA